MAKNSLQDKFQTSYPYKEEDDENANWEWAKNGTLRGRPLSGGMAGEIGFSPLAQYKSSQPFLHPKGNAESVNTTAARNDPPRRTDLQEWVIKENGGMKLVTASATDVTNDVEAKALKNGFTYHDMDSVDDEYTGANQDHFYGEAIGPDDGGNEVVGFVERNNYLDRL
jgi:hypothetical protein